MQIVYHTAACAATEAVVMCAPGTGGVWATRIILLLRTSLLMLLLATVLLHVIVAVLHLRLGLILGVGQGGIHE